MKALTLLRIIWKLSLIAAHFLCCLLMVISWLRPDNKAAPLPAVVIVKLYAMGLAVVLAIAELKRRWLVRQWAIVLRHHGIRAVCSGLVVAAAFVPNNSEDSVRPEEQAFGYILLVLICLQLLAYLSCLDRLCTQRESRQTEVEREKRRKGRNDVHGYHNDYANNLDEGEGEGEEQDAAMQIEVPESEAETERPASSVHTSSI
jgi:hypothetical protein